MEAFMFFMTEKGAKLTLCSTGIILDFKVFFCSGWVKQEYIYQSISVQLPGYVRETTK